MSEAVSRLEVRHVSRSFEGRRVVNDVSLSVAAGEVTCLLGPSGCGKSTTLRMIAGVETCDSGEILVDGQCFAGQSKFVPPEERGIGLMFQDFALFPHMSVIDNVAYGVSGPKPARQARAAEMLARVRMDAFAQMFPHQLSGGEQQRVALARALAPRPKIMLMDEPFSGLDKRLRDGIRDETLALLKEEDTAVLLVTHEPEEAMRMGDTIALMREGRIVQRGSPHEIYAQASDLEAVSFFSDINALKGVVQEGEAQTPLGAFAANGVADGTPVDIVFRPQHVRIDFDRAGFAPPASATEGVAARAITQRARFLGRDSLVEFELDDGETQITAVVPNVFLPQAGTVMWVRVPRARCFVFASQG